MFCFLLLYAQMWPQVTFSFSAPRYHGCSLLEEACELCSVFKHPVGSGLCAGFPCPGMLPSLTATTRRHVGWQVRRAQAGSRLGLEVGDRDSDGSRIRTSGTLAKNVCCGAQHERCHGGSVLKQSSPGNPVASHFETHYVIMFIHSPNK